jgi:hypothetical protein
LGDGGKIEGENGGAYMGYGGNKQVGVEYLLDKPIDMAFYKCI